MSEGFSLLSRCRAFRDLPTALAHEMVRTNPRSDRMELLNRIYLDLTWGARLQCRRELTRCRQAMRGHFEATVALAG